MRTATAALRLAAGDPQTAADLLAPVLDGSLAGVRLIAQILDLLPGSAAPGPPPGGPAGQPRDRGLDEPLTDSETRVLRYLRPTSRRPRSPPSSGCR